MEHLRALRTFIAVAEQASFARAALQLRMSPATVTRSVAALEASLGTALLVRTTRAVRLTEQGEMFLDRCRAGIAEIDGAIAAVQGGSVRPRGTLTITAPVMFGRLHILPVVQELIGKYPELNIRLLLLDRMVRLVEEGVDVAVRIADLPNSALHMMKIGEVHSVLSASPDYLRDRSTPKRRGDLRHHQIIEIEDDHGNSAVRQQARGEEKGVRLSLNSMEAGIDAALAGMGIVRTLSYQVASHWETGRLQRILIDEESSPRPISLLFQSGRRDTPNIRAFIELAREKLKGPVI